MLTGVRALDKFSRQRLGWHIERALADPPVEERVLLAGSWAARGRTAEEPRYNGADGRSCGALDEHDGTLSVERAVGRPSASAYGDFPADTAPDAAEGPRGPSG